MNDPIVTVSNVLPELSNLVATATLENGFTTLTGNISDAGVLDSFTLNVDWGDGTATEIFSFQPGTDEFSVNHQYLDDGCPPIRPTITRLQRCCLTTTIC